MKNSQFYISQVIKTQSKKHCWINSLINEITERINIYEASWFRYSTSMVQHFRKHRRIICLNYAYSVFCSLNYSRFEITLSTPYISALSIKSQQISLNLLNLNRFSSIK